MIKRFIGWLFNSGAQWQVKAIARNPLQFTEDERMLFNLLPKEDQVKYAQAYFGKPEYIISIDGKVELIHD